MMWSKVGRGRSSGFPPDVVHCGEAIGGGGCAHNLDVLAPVREDYNHLTEYQEPDFD